MKRNSIWQVHWKWTEWDSTSQHPDTPLLSSSYTDTHNASSWTKRNRPWRSTAFGTCIASEHSETRLLNIPDTPLLSSSHTDTHNASSCRERNWRWRSTASGKCIASEHSETRLLNIPTLLCYLHLTQTLTTLHLAVNEIGEEGAQHLTSALQVNTVRLDFWTSWHSSAIFILHRHSQRLILNETKLAMKEHSIWHVHWKWTEWDSTSQHPDTPLLSSSHTDTHNA